MYESNFASIYEVYVHGNMAETHVLDLHDNKNIYKMPGKTNDVTKNKNTSGICVQILNQNDILNYIILTACIFGKLTNGH